MFDFTDQMRQLCGEVVRRTPQLVHIDMRRVAVSFARCRKPATHGLQATLTPLRFEAGRLLGWCDNQLFTCQRLWSEGEEVLYILTFYLPRFMDLSFEEKLVTVFHELWHISPRFDGDLRRHAGRCYLHTRSEQQYDQAMRELAQRWLTTDPPASCFAFLREDFQGLASSYVRIVGTRWPHPKLIPLSSP